jgi:hypothetical protein
MLKIQVNPLCNVPGIHMDYAVSCLKAQLGTINSVLQNIEMSNNPETGYIKESLKRVETDIKKIRRFF